MRRSEYQCHDPEEFRHIVETAPVGHLGIITPDGYPRVVPMNFAADGEIIYLHSANEGEKYEVMLTSPKVTFSAEIDYAYIPSYWTSKISAGTATMFYKSTLIKGQGNVLDDDAERIHGLQLLMDKYQPEGGFEPLKIDSKIYRHLMKATAVYKIIPHHVDVKINFREKKSREYNEMLIRRLKERNGPRDDATIFEIQKILDRME